ncbi:MAG: GNAT family N-acetyltransferase, partial [Candidatus Magasanikbacteria bacterium]|nr:GNAT family N-acetyltransferase [Candidatus Magasanikbacteria bacterium]
MIPVIRRIKNLAELGSKKDDLCEVYKQAFRRRPYFEYFPEGNSDEVIYRLNCTVNNPGGVCCVMFLDEKPIGVAGGYSLECEEEIAGIFQETFLGTKIKNIFFLAELAIGDAYLGNGYGKMLIAEREK